MIEANQLRIGNLVWESNSFAPSPEDFNEITIASINDIDKVIRDNQGNGYSYDALYPIPLTPEWFRRMNFKKELRGWSLLTGFHLFDYKGDLVFKVLDQIVNYTPITKVHQLQNLYFSLCGHELQIKETA
jgi:hypothetical protein